MLNSQLEPKESNIEASVCLFVCFFQLYILPCSNKKYLRGTKFSLLASVSGAITSIWANHPSQGPCFHTFCDIFSPKGHDNQRVGVLYMCFHATHVHVLHPRPQACQKLLHAVSGQEMRRCEISEAANVSASNLISKIKIICPGRPRSQPDSCRHV